MYLGRLIGERDFAGRSSGSARGLNVVSGLRFGLASPNSLPGRSTVGICGGSTAASTTSDSVI